MSLKQLEAKYSASQVSNEAKSSRRVQEAQEKADRLFDLSTRYLNH